MHNPFELLVTYADYREGFVAEVWLNNIHIAEVYEDAQGDKRVELYFMQKQDLSLPLEALQETLQRAKETLWPTVRPE
ncbi:hypothetical protein [Hymenobacter canadensis]|uniref:DUF2283 domain-containing protein n=1 Tax=Hymenobacter canadensis TaxID=2999067 RepID=A0ABY7LVB7_9BACT|nr:hypothetical protein [Hymenobacter canadensis]WBA43991.1 hypothetical protein O3303_20720 [Hymenobacter canadensis]